MIRMRLDRVEPYVYQWDTKQWISIVNLDSAVMAFASHKGDKQALNLGVISPTAPKFKIPDILLRDEGTLTIYLVNSYSGQNTTVCVQDFKIKPRPKPEGYVYDEKDIYTWEDLKQRVFDLEDKWFDLDDTLSKPGFAADAAKVGQEFDATKKQQKEFLDSHNSSPDSHLDIRKRIDAIKIPTDLSAFKEDETHRLVTDAEKKTWNNKSDFSGSYNDLADIPTDLAKQDYVQTTIDQKITTHNTSAEAHKDIRNLIADIDKRLNAFFDTEDINLDQLSEIVQFIKDNRTTIEEITSGKVNVSDIIDNLTTNDPKKVLSANQGVVLKKMIDDAVLALNQSLENTNNAIPVALSQLKEDTDHKVVSTTEKEKWNTVDNKLSLTGGQLTGTLDMSNHAITNLPEASNNQDPVVLSQLNEVQTTLSKFYTPKGSVQKYSLLPSQNVNGDFYFVEEDETIENVTYLGQHDYAWIENRWLDMGKRVSIDTTLAREGRAADAKKVGDELASVKADASSLHSSIQTHDNKIESNQKLHDLQEGVVDTFQVFTKDQKGNITKIVHKKIGNNNVVRTDTFTYFENNMTEERVLATGEKITYTMDLNTFETKIKLDI